MEVRCAKNSNLTEWGPPDFIYQAYFYRALPYPLRGINLSCEPFNLLLFLVQLCHADSSE